METISQRHGSCLSSSQASQTSSSEAALRRGQPQLQHPAVFSTALSQQQRSPALITHVLLGSKQNPFQSCQAFFFQKQLGSWLCFSPACLSLDTFLKLPHISGTNRAGQHRAWGSQHFLLPPCTPLQQKPKRAWLTQLTRLKLSVFLVLDSHSYINHERITTSQFCCQYPIRDRHQALPDNHADPEQRLIQV